MESEYPLLNEVSVRDFPLSLYGVKLLYIYRCELTPTSSVCSSTFVSQYTHYIPLRSRNTTSYQELLEEIVASDNFDENCTDILVSLGCYITYPPCDSETGDAIPLCTENCNTEFASIQSCVAQVTVNNELSARMAMFNCSDVSSYLPEFVQFNSSQCVNLTDCKFMW